MPLLTDASAIYAGSSPAQAVYAGATQVWSAGGTEYAVGSFTANTATGAQAVTGLGFTPKAILFWTSGSYTTSGTWQSLIHQSIGFTSGPTESYSVAGGSRDNVATSDTSRRIAAKAITFIDWNATTVWGESDLTSFDADGFTLDWTTAAAASMTIMFLAIGGDSVEAKVVNWTSPTSTGDKAVTGVGFTPDVVLHANTIQTTLTSEANHFANIGAMSADGGQWSNAVSALDGQATTDTYRYQSASHCISAISSALYEQATFSSMDADGFTLNFGTKSDSFARQYISLCLSGVSAKVGSFAKTTDAAPASQAVTGVGFEPGAALWSSYGATANASVLNGAAWSLGAADGTNERATAQVDANNFPTTQADSLWHNDKAVLAQSNSGNPPTTDAAADLTSFDADGYTLNWTTNDVAAREILYLALA